MHSPNLWIRSIITLLPFSVKFETVFSDPLKTLYLIKPRSLSRLRSRRISIPDQDESSDS